MTVYFPAVSPDNDIANFRFLFVWAFCSPTSLSFSVPKLALNGKGAFSTSQVRGSHVGTHLPTSGIWQHTQRYLKKGASNPKIIHHLDFDAATREHAQQLPDDKVLSRKEPP